MALFNKSAGDLHSVTHHILLIFTPQLVGSTNHGNVWRWYCIMRYGKPTFRYTNQYIPVSGSVPKRPGLGQKPPGLHVI